LYLDITYKDPVKIIEPLRSNIIDIPVYVLNLTKDFKRKDHMTQLLINLGFKHFTFVEPVDIQTSINFYKLHGIDIPPTTASRCLSTFKIFNMVKSGDFIIAEDDINIFNDKCNIDKIYNNAKKVDYDLLYFEMCWMNCNQSLKISDCLFKLHNPLCNGFILHKYESINKIRKFFLDNLSYDPIDLVMADMCKNDILKAYGYPIFRQDPRFGSNIETSARWTNKSIVFDKICVI
jgi:hypothetical protein